MAQTVGSEFQYQHTPEGEGETRPVGDLPGFVQLYQDLLSATASTSTGRDRNTRDKNSTRINTNISNSSKNANSPHANANTNTSASTAVSVAVPSSPGAGGYDPDEEEEGDGWGDDDDFETTLDDPQLVSDWGNLTMGTADGGWADNGGYADYTSCGVSEGSLRGLMDDPLFPLGEDGYGNTLLHYGALMNAPTLVRRLLAAGADLYALNKEGKDALDIAAVRENGEVLRVLEREDERRRRQVKAYESRAVPLATFVDVVIPESFKGRP
jgi:hypothetical protein